MKFKKCSNCFDSKPVSEFYVKRPSGYQSRCKKCNPEVCKGYRERKKREVIDKRWTEMFKPTRGLTLELKNPPLLGLQ